MIIDKNTADNVIARIKGSFAYVVHSTNARMFHADLTGKFSPVKFFGGEIDLYGEINGETLPLLRGFEKMLVEDREFFPAERRVIPGNIREAAQKGNEHARNIIFYYASGLVHYFNTPLEILAGKIPASENLSSLFDVFLIRDPREGGIAHYNEETLSR